MSTEAVYQFGAGNPALRTAKALGDHTRRIVTDRRVLLTAGITIGLMLVAFTYCWTLASREIDVRLAGGAVDMRSGIYAAPLVVRAGQPLAREDLVAYLQQLGYSSSDNSDGAAAGRYAIDGDAVTIEPDRTTAAAGRYAAVRVEFSGERGVRRIVDPRSDERLKEAALEPLRISAANSAKQKRIPVTFDAIPESLRRAILVTEDRRFWEHNGVDVRAVARAVRENFDEGGVVQGGSTITQQVVKNLFLTPERTYTRKVKEAFLSYVLESKLDKQEIFALYCNEVYLGQSGTYAVHGVAEAAQRFFGKDLASLTLDESALLAGLINSPNSNSPYRHPERAKLRRDLVLDMMAETGAATGAEVEAAKARPIQLVPVERDSEWLDAPYFDDYVRDYIDEAYGGLDAAAGRLRIDTTIDINLQRAATQTIAEHLEKLDKVFAKGKNAVQPGTVQAALVALDARTGEVLAMVGGRDYDASQLNRATDAMRQPGSVFKPFVYTAAISSRRFTPATPIMDAPMKFTYGNGTYEPGNFGESYANRDVSVRTALTYSKNVPTVEVAMRTGLSYIASVAERAGLPRPEAYPAMALGTYEATPLQIAQAYTMFPDGGKSVEPTPIAAVERGGAAVERRPPASVVCSPQVAYVITDMLEGVVSHGTGAGVRARGVHGAVAGKTGTSRDAWFAGYTPNMVCVVWVGFDDGRQLGMTGSAAALPIWADFVKQAVAFRPDLGGDAFPRPSGLTTAKVCDETGLLATDMCPSAHEELFVGGTEPSATCQLHSMEYADGMVPMYDENGNFIGFAPSPEDTTAEYAPQPEEIVVPGDSEPRTEAPPIPGMVALPPPPPPEPGRKPDSKAKKKETTDKRPQLEPSPADDEEPEGGP